MSNAPDIIKDLVERFNSDLEGYRAYNEEDLKNEFLNPFFIALGWDVYNNSGKTIWDKDVIFEDSIKVDDTYRAPDYCFRIDGKRQFFVEAKRPSVNIETEINPAFQLKRYAWSANLPLSILTDFEEFAVYKLSKRPKRNDRARVDREMYFTYDEYVDRWDEIYSVFSRDAVLSGAYNEFAKEKMPTRGTETVDSEFLAEIEKWREILAKNISLRNPGISVQEINYAVQQIIDRIVFIRMSEDRGIEKYGLLKTFLDEDNVYDKFCEFCIKADDKYNSGLFHFKTERERTSSPDMITPNLNIDNGALRVIIDSLYLPNSPYEFSVLPPEILGNVYEQFLGKIITFDDSNKAVIKEKPEVKKAGGVYYTPDYIVDYVVSQTLGKLVRNKTPETLAELKILDPACGSGSFLLGAYSYLLDYHLAYYKSSIDKLTEKRKIKSKIIKLKDKIYRKNDGEWYLTIKEKKRILLNNIHGVDIDPQAVEVTKLSLLLKVLEGEDEDELEKQQTFIKERALPDLDNNIKCGNSLIDSQFYEDDQELTQYELFRVNTFDWDTSFPDVDKFDVVIGNPPYISIQNLNSFYPKEVDFYQRNYSTASERNVDIYVPFIEKSLSLLKPGGVLGFICPNRFFNSDYGVKIREYIKDYNLYHLVNFRHYLVFKNADTYTCLLFIQNKKQQRNLIYKEIRDLYENESFKVGKFLNKSTKSENNFIFDRIKPHFLKQDKWYFMTEDEEMVFEKITNNKKFSDFYQLNFQGLITGMDPVFILRLIEDRGTTKIFFSRALKNEIELESEIIYKIIADSDIANYKVKDTNDYVIFPYHKGELINDSILKTKYPLTWNYLKTFERNLRLREGGKKFNNDSWYQFSRNQNITKQELVKILIPHVVKFTRVAFDEMGEVFIKNVGVNGVVLKEEVEEHPYYFLAILNSYLTSFFISKTSIFLRNGYYATNKQFASEIPIAKINFSDTTSRDLHDKIVKHTGWLLKLNKELDVSKIPNEIDRIKRQIDVVKARINRFIYQELYGLEEEDIQIIENTLNIN